MFETISPYVIPVTMVLIAVGSLIFAPRAQHAEGFFAGESPQRTQPRLLTLIFSQVTTWIFARSLLNAAILGFYYGLWGTLAYAAYYLSFITGWFIVDSVRFRHGCSSVQEFLQQRFGKMGVHCYNLVLALRLVSEVFANILVIGLMFGVAGSNTYVLGVAVFSAVTLAYSMLGGLHASLRTDLFQMSLFIFLLVGLIFAASGEYSMAVINFVPFEISEPGPILLMVALLQVWSYPMHDPVMMDRGFIADRKTTRGSFLHASWISVLCIIAFGSLGIVAGANKMDGEMMETVLARLLGNPMMILFQVTLLVSAMSTLDSTFSSAAKLVVRDMGLTNNSMNAGRGVMAGFLLMGLALVFLGNKDLFSAVAVSGTASMYLIPVIFFSLWGNQQHIAKWAYAVAFAIAIAGAALYFTESSKHTDLLGDAHKYTKLLWICLVVMVVGCGAFLLSMWQQRSARS